MRRLLTATLVSLTIAGAVGVPAFAQADNNQPQAIAENKTDKAADDATKSETKTDAAKSASTAATKTAKAPAKKGSSKISTGFASRLASTVVGTVVGIPVVMCKRSYSESVTATKELVGDSGNKFLFAAGTPLGVPAGVLSGVLQAPVVGFWHAWKNSADEPFSSEVFSMGTEK